MGAAEVTGFLVRAKRPEHLPVVLTREEIRAIVKAPSTHTGRRLRGESDHYP
jgi:hypothetical protein